MKDNQTIFVPVSHNNRILNPDSLLLLGREYLLGEKIPPDLLRGVTYLQRSAMRGSRVAASTLGAVLDEGFSKEVIYLQTPTLRGNQKLRSSRAIRWYYKAAKMGCKRCCSRLVEIYFLPRVNQKSVEQGLKYYSWLDKSEQSGPLAQMVHDSLIHRQGRTNKKESQYPKSCSCGFQIANFKDYLDKVRVSGIQGGLNEFNLLLGSCPSCHSTISIRILKGGAKSDKRPFQ